MDYGLFKIMDIKTKKDFYILPPEIGSCSVCGYDHKINHPHKPGSLYYQITFYYKYDRYPTWADAIEHLSGAQKLLIKNYVINNSDEWQKCELPISEPYKKQE